MKKSRELSNEEKKAVIRIRELINDYCEGSQQIFADKTGLSKASVSLYVSGKNLPGNITAAHIAEIFDVNPVWLMGFDVPKDPSALYPEDYTYHEKDLIRAYRRSSDEIKNAVCAVLGIKRAQNSDKEGFSSG